MKQWCRAGLALAVLVGSVPGGWAQTQTCSGGSGSSSCPQGTKVKFWYELDGDSLNAPNGIVIKGDFAGDGMGKTEYGLQGTHKLKMEEVYEICFNGATLGIEDIGQASGITVHFPHCFSHTHADPWDCGDVSTASVPREDGWARSNEKGFSISAGQEEIPDFIFMLREERDNKKDQDNAGERLSPISQPPSVTPGGGGGGQPPIVQGDSAATVSAGMGLGNVKLGDSWRSAGQLIVGGEISGNLSSPKSLYLAGRPTSMVITNGQLGTEPARDEAGSLVVAVTDQHGQPITGNSPELGQMIKKVVTPYYTADVKPMVNGAVQDTPTPQDFETADGFRVEVCQKEAGGNEFLSSYTYEKVPAFGEFEDGLKVTQRIRGEIVHEEVSMASSLTGHTGQSLFQGQLDGNQRFLHGTYILSSDTETNPDSQYPERLCTHIGYRDGEVVSSRTEVYRLYPWGEEMIALEEDPTPGADGHPDGGDDSRYTTWDYYDAPSANPNDSPGSYGRLKSTTSSEGSWSLYTYTSGGGVDKVYEPFGNYQVALPAQVPNNLLIGMKMTVHQYGRYGNSGSETFANIGGGASRINKTHSIQNNVFSSESIQYARSGGIHTKEYTSYMTDGPAKGRPESRSMDKIRSGLDMSGEIEFTEYFYDDGTWNSTTKTFNVDGTGAGPDLRIIEQKMVAPSMVLPAQDPAQGDPVPDVPPLAYIPNMSTRSVRYESGVHGLVCERTEIYEGNQTWSLATETEYSYDDRGRLIEVKKDGAIISGTRYPSEKEVVNVDSSGRETRTEYHDDGTLWKTTVVEGGAGVGDIVTEYLRNGRTTTITVNGIVESVTTVDCLGRTIQSMDRLGQVTHYSYTMNGAGKRNSRTMWRNVIDDEGGAQVLDTITTTNPDGSVHSITGNAIVPEYYSYSIHPAGSGDFFLSTRVETGFPGSPRKRTTINRWDGSPYQIIIPDPSDVTGATTVTREYHYDDTAHGQLMRISSTATNVADQVYGYDPADPAVLSAASVLGMYSYSGLDADGDGVASLSSEDRLTISSGEYEKDGSGKWFLVNTTKRLKTKYNANDGYESKTKQRLWTSSGSVNNTRAEALVIQIQENGEVIEQVRQSALLSSSPTGVTAVDKKVIQTTSSSRSSEEAITVTENGYLSSSRGLVSGETDENGAVNDKETYRYNSLGYLIEQTNVREATTTFEYNAFGQRLSSTDALGNKTQYEYYSAGHHAAGRVSRMINPEGEVTETRYTLRGQIAEVRGDGVYRQVYEYDDYDQLKNLITYRDENTPSVTTWEYYPATGLLERKVYDANPDGTGASERFYHYRPSGRLEIRAGGRGQETVYTYNAMGDRLYVDYDDGLTPHIDTPSSSYDRLGRLTQLTQKFSQVGLTDGTVTFEYGDSIGSLQRVSYAADHPYLPNRSIRYYAPDNNGRYAGYFLQEGDDRIGDGVKYGYDALGRIDQLEIRHNPNPATQPVDDKTYFNYFYYPNTSLLKESDYKTQLVNSPKKYSAVRSLDRLGRVSSVVSKTWGSSAGLKVTSIAGYRYDKAGRRISLTREDGTHWKYAYNKRGELIDGRKYLSDGTDALLAGQQFSYTYDGIGNRKTASYGGDDQGGNRRTITYTANNENQYTGISYATSGTTTRYANVLAKAPVNSNVTVTADGVNQSVTSQQQWYRSEISKDGDSWEKIAVAVGDETASESGDIWLPPANYSPQYDGDGNLTNDGRWKYTWDAENRLIRMHTLKNNGTQLTVNTDAEHMVLDFAYDWLGRRIGKKVTGTGANNVLKDQRYLYDAWNLCAELDGTNNLSIIREYFWGIDLSGTRQGAGGVGGLLGVRVNDGAQRPVIFPSYDGNGNIIAWSEDAKVALEIYDYDPFGNIASKQKHSQISGGSIPYGFSTKYTDQETELLYYGYRYYNPKTGRWLSKDPIDELGGVNLYAMASNNIVNDYDLNGMIAGKIFSDLLKRTKRLYSQCPKKKGCFFNKSKCFVCCGAVSAVASKAISAAAAAAKCLALGNPVAIAYCELEVAEGAAEALKSIKKNDIACKKACPPVCCKSPSDKFKDWVKDKWGIDLRK